MYLCRVIILNWSYKELDSKTRSSAAHQGVTYTIIVIRFMYFTALFSSITVCCKETIIVRWLFGETRTFLSICWPNCVLQCNKTSYVPVNERLARKAKCRRRFKIENRWPVGTVYRDRGRIGVVQRRVEHPAKEVSSKAWTPTDRSADLTRPFDRPLFLKTENQIAVLHSHNGSLLFYSISTDIVHENYLCP